MRSQQADAITHAVQQAATASICHLAIGTAVPLPLPGARARCRMSHGLYEAIGNAKRNAAHPPCDSARNHPSFEQNIRASAPQQLRRRGSTSARSHQRQPTLPVGQSASLCPPLHGHPTLQAQAGSWLQHHRQHSCDSSAPGPSVASITAGLAAQALPLWCPTVAAS